MSALLTRRRWIVGIAALAIAAVAFASQFGGTRERDDTAPTGSSDAGRATDPCALWATDELSGWLGGSEWAAEPGEGVASCAYHEVDGPGTVTVAISETTAPWQFELLYSGRPAPAPTEGIGDEAWWWEEPALPGASLVLRVGGRAALITLGGQYPDRLAAASAGEVPVGTQPDLAEASGSTNPQVTEEGSSGMAPFGAQEASAEVFARLDELGAAAAGRLLPAPYDVGASGEGDPTSSPSGVEVRVAIQVCEAISLEALTDTLGLSPEGAGLSPFGERACTFDHPSGVNILVEPVTADAGDTALDSGRETMVDGQTTTWTPEPVEGIGDGAVWLADPITGTTGELSALFGSVLVRITSSGPSAEGVRDRAIAVMMLAGSDVAGVIE